MARVTTSVPEPAGPEPGVPGDPVPAPAEAVVDAGDVALRAYVTRRPGLPADADTVVAVHGYPDTHAEWDPVVADLAADHVVVTYDVRGAGGSSAPASLAGYRTERLVDDLVAVLDALPDLDPDLRAALDPALDGDRPGRAVHLLGHDWGSVQLWDAVVAEERDPRLTGRIASFCSVSGPSLDHVAGFVRNAPASDVRSQRRRSWYVRAFHLPVLPEMAWRHLAGPMRRRLAGAEGLVAADGPEGHWAASLPADAVHGLGLYRANVRRRLARPGDGRTRVPVLLVAPRHDRFIAPARLAHVATVVPTLERVDVDAGHWVVRTHPALLAGLVRDFAARHPSPP